MIYLFLQTLTLLATIFAAKGTIKILLLWDFDKTTQTQYKLEHSSYLVMIVITFITVIKIAMLPFFAFLTDQLSFIIPGAMCAAGVLEEFAYNHFLLSLKLSIIFLGGLWLLLNSHDLLEKNYPYMRLKSALFLFVSLLIALEYGFELFYLFSLSTQEPVSCCTDIFGAVGVSQSLPFGLNIQTLLVLFYATFLLTLFSAFGKNGLLSFITNIFFLMIAYYSLVHFFGTYIYQQPTHRCPFCMLQPEYYYVGYLLWGSLFAGVFSAVAAFIMGLIKTKNVNKLFYANIFFQSLFALTCTYFVVSYYIINGVFL